MLRKEDEAELQDVINNVRIISDGELVDGLEVAERMVVAFKAEIARRQEQPK